jgi:hypothetical protein
MVLSVSLGYLIRPKQEGGRSRLIGDAFSICSRIAAGSTATFRFVSVAPGITTFTRIPAGPSPFEMYA